MSYCGMFGIGEESWKQHRIYTVTWITTTTKSFAPLATPRYPEDSTAKFSRLLNSKGSFVRRATSKTSLIFYHVFLSKWNNSDWWEVEKFWLQFSGTPYWRNCKNPLNVFGKYLGKMKRAYVCIYCDMYAEYIISW